MYDSNDMLNKGLNGGAKTSKKTSKKTVSKENIPTENNIIKIYTYDWIL